MGLKVLKKTAQETAVRVIAARFAVTSFKITEEKQKLRIKFGVAGRIESKPTGKYQVITAKGCAGFRAR